MVQRIKRYIIIMCEVLHMYFPRLHGISSSRYILSNGRKRNYTNGVRFSFFGVKYVYVEMYCKP